MCDGNCSGQRHVFEYSHRAPRVEEWVLLSFELSQGKGMEGVATCVMAIVQDNVMFSGTVIVLRGLRNGYYWVLNSHRGRVWRVWLHVWWQLFRTTSCFRVQSSCSAVWGMGTIEFWTLTGEGYGGCGYMCDSNCSGQRHVFEYSHRAPRFEEWVLLSFELSQGEGVAYRGRLLVELNTELTEEVGNPMEDMKAGEAIKIQVTWFWCKKPLIIFSATVPLWGFAAIVLHISVESLLYNCTSDKLKSEISSRYSRPNFLPVFCTLPLSLPMSLLSQPPSSRSIHAFFLIGVSEIFPGRLSVMY